MAWASLASVTRGADQARVREVLELADADAEERRQALVAPGLAVQGDVPEVGAGEHALHLADVAFDRQRVAQLDAGPQLQHRLGLEAAPGAAHLHPPRQVVVDRDVAKGLGAAGDGERGLELCAMNPAELATVGAHLVPVGVAQLDHHRLAALDDEEHRVAAARAGAHLEVGVGNGEALADARRCVVGSLLRARRRSANDPNSPIKVAATRQDSMEVIACCRRRWRGLRG